jgi:hypothetical protein
MESTAQKFFKIISYLEPMRVPLYYIVLHTKFICYFKHLVWL